MSRNARLVASALRAIAGLLAVLSLSACGPGQEVVARAGVVTITAEDVAYRQAVLEVRSAKSVEAHWPSSRSWRKR